MAAFLDNFSDLEELGIDCENDDSLTDSFNKAANHLPKLLPNLDSQVLLTLYGYYKQGSQGPCNMPKPSWYDMKAKSKWEAWNKLGNMSQKEAKTFYVDTIKNLDPDFNCAAKEQWVCVSTLQSNDSTNEKQTSYLSDFVKENNLSEVEKILRCISKDEINRVDQGGLSAIHWAADRGSYEILQLLIDADADINLQDLDGQTALHYASSCGHLECVKLLLDKNADKDILDNDGESPKSVACDDAVKELFMRL